MDRSNSDSNDNPGAMDSGNGSTDSQSNIGNDTVSSSSHQIVSFGTAHHHNAPIAGQSFSATPASLASLSSSAFATFSALPASFTYNDWGPVPGAGLSYLGLIPAWYNGKDIAQVHSSVGKVKVSRQRRQTRHQNFKSVKPPGPDSHGGKLLRDAVSANDEDTVERLLESGVDANSADSKQRTALHIAAAKGKEKIVHLLLNYGADPNSQDSNGNTPLHLASCTCQVTVITLLLKAGTDVSTLDKNGKTPLHLARGRLLLLQEDLSYSNEQLNTQVTQVVDMIKAYVYRKQITTGMIRNPKDELDELEKLCDAFANTSTREEVVDHVGNLLSHLNLQPSDSDADSVAQCLS